MKKPITFISILCSILFLTAIIFFASGIYIDKKNGTAKADARYEQLLKQTKENFENNTYGSSAFSINFIQAIGNINDFSSLKLEVNGSLIYSYPPSTFSLPSPELVKSYSDTVNVAGKNFTLRASLYLMTPGSIYNHSRFAFLLILIGTLIVGIFIVFTNGAESSSNDFYEIRPKNKNIFTEREIFSDSKSESKDNSENTEEKPEYEENSVSEQITESSNAIEEAPKAEQQPLFNPEQISTEISSEEHSSKDIFQEDKVEEEPSEEEPSIEIPNEVPVFTEEDEQEWNTDELFSDEDEKTEKDEGGLDIIDQMEQENLALSDEDFFADKTEPQESEKELESNAVSQITNLSLQSSLEESLDAAIESDSNTTLSLIKINGLDRGNYLSQTIVSIIKNATNTSRLFEYKADSYAAIVQTDLQETVDNFEGIYNKIADFLKDNNAVNEVSVGISSASGRSIKAERLILEASQALDYASQDPDSPIVAFRANPEKYKEYMESNN